MAEEKKARKASRKMQAFIGRFDPSGEEGVKTVLTVFAVTGIGEKAINAAAGKLGPGTYDVVTGRVAVLAVTEVKRNVVKKV